MKERQHSLVVSMLSVVALVMACSGSEDLGSLPGAGGGKGDNLNLNEDGEPIGWTLHLMDGSGNGADGVDVADVNGDGLPDVTSGWTESGWVKVYFNPGASSVREAWPAVDVCGGLDVTGAVEDAVFADLDLDGKVDAVVSANEGSVQRVGVHSLEKPEMSSSPSAWDGNWIGPRSYALHLKAAVGQIDGQRGNDIVVGSMASWYENGHLFWFRAPKKLGWSTAYKWERFEIGGVEKITGIKILDMDGDGDNDVLYTGTKRLRWRENPGPGEMLEEGHWQGHSIDEAGVKDVNLCDVDQDGEQDIVVATSGSYENPETVAVWYRRLDSSGHSWQRYEVQAEGGRPGDFAHKGIACADFDGDGRIDLALTGSNKGHGVYGVSYTGDTPRDSGQWRLWLVDRYRDEMKYDNLVAADLDGDGDVDLLTTEENVGSGSRGLGVVWFENLLQ